MNDLDAMPFNLVPPEPETARTLVPSKRRCSHPKPHRVTLPEGGWQCASCSTIVTPETMRRGRRSRRLGTDQERRAERRYGWEKIGERNQATDLRGRLFKVQQKATRSAPPSKWMRIFGDLDATRDGRVPLLLLSFVRNGLPTEDFVLVRGSDWLDLHGRDEPEEAA